MKPTDPTDTARCQRANDVIALIGDKWSVQVVMRLGRSKSRFTELRRAVEGISQKMLTVTLRGLERDGYVHRAAYPTIPPRVEYELTDLGRELLVPLEAFGEWAIANHGRVVQARAAYDVRRIAQAAE